MRNQAKEAWADIDVQLKRRYNLIPNIVESVKGYATHEESVLTKVTEARANAINASGIPEQGAAENMLTGALKSLFAVAENYPDLKANENFLQLQNELVDTEDKIQAARRFYNSVTRDYNTKIEQFPASVVANMFKFVSNEFFEVENEEERENVKVDFGTRDDKPAEEPAKEETPAVAEAVPAETPAEEPAVVEEKVETPVEPVAEPAVEEKKEEEPVKEETPVETPAEEPKVEEEKEEPAPTEEAKEEEAPKEEEKPAEEASDSEEEEKKEEEVKEEPKAEEAPEGMAPLSAEAPATEEKTEEPKAEEKPEEEKKEGDDEQEKINL